MCVCSSTELEKTASILDSTRSRAEHAERARDEAQVEIASLRTRLAVLDDSVAEKDRTIAQLLREAEKLRIRAPKKQMGGDKMERLQDRKADYASTRALREGGTGFGPVSSLSMVAQTRAGRAISLSSEDEMTRISHLERSETFGSDGERMRGMSVEDKYKERSNLAVDRARAVRRKSSAEEQREPAGEPKQKESEVKENEKKTQPISKGQEDSRQPPTGTSAGPLTIQPIEQARQSTEESVHVPEMKEVVTKENSVRTTTGQWAEKMQEKQEDYFVESKQLSDKDKKRRDIERQIVEHLRNKYEGKTTLVALENEAIMTLLKDPRWYFNFRHFGRISPLSYTLVQRHYLAQLYPFPLMRTGAWLCVGCACAIVCDIQLLVLLETTRGKGASYSLLRLMHGALIISADQRG